MLKVLIIDDSKAVHAFITSTLSRVGMELTHVFNGQEGLDTLQKKAGAFDLVLLDWEMPVLNGPDTFDRLHAQFPHLPVLMMTTKNEPEDISLMIGRGVNEYMLKPFTADIIFEKIEIALGKAVSRVA